MKLSLTSTTTATWIALGCVGSLSTSAEAMLLMMQQQDSPCNGATSKTDCFATHESDGSACEWCVAGAIPSECMSQEQAQQLPEGVFDCSSPSTMEEEEMEETTPRFLFNDKEYQVKAGVPQQDDVCDASSLSISGYMDIKGSQFDKDGENKHYFFWMFEKRDTSQDDDDEEIPFVVWMNGGPGCSSTMGLLTENGPCSVNPDGKGTTVNPYSWTEAAHVLWLDQPAGVGFSYGEQTDANEQMVSEDAYYFFQAFFQTYPEYASSPLYITGESYAGHYIPAIARRIYHGNQDHATDTIFLNLAGIAIGNGLTDPELQYPAYPDMMYNNSHGMQLVDEGVYETMKSVVSTCTAMIHKCNSGDSVINDFACQSAYYVCNLGLTSPYQATGLNPYDIRLKCEVPPLCYDFSRVQTFLRLDSTKKALNIDTHHSHSWSSCNFAINHEFMGDWMKSYASYVTELLDEAKIKALIYVGDVDFICNYIGNENWTYNLEWSGKKGFQEAEMHDWKGQGLARVADNLTYLRVYDAGHMVPTDQPQVALDMLKNFLSGGKF